MKIKLFFTSILALLALVAYQKYTEYSALKSIDSYEACASAKGSMIQESYPATCITRLGSQFTQLVPLDISKWKSFSGNKYSFKYPESGSMSIDEDLAILTYPTENGEMKITFNIHKPQGNSLKDYLIARYLPNSDGNQTVVPAESAQIAGFDGYQASIRAVDAGGYSYFVFESEDKKNVMDIEHYSFADIGWIDGPSPEQVSEANKQRELFSQILSTFKFTN